MHIPLEVLISSRNLIAFSQGEATYLRMFMEMEAKAGLGIHLHRIFYNDAADAADWMRKGLLLFNLPEIGSDVVVVKHSLGRKLFGGAKLRYTQCFGSFKDNEFLIGSDSRSLLMCLTGINNVYRSEGILSGSASN